MNYVETYLKNQVNIEQLHEVIEGKHFNERRAGHTFAALMLLLGEAQLGYTGNFLYIGENYYHVTDVCKSFEQILAAEGLLNTTPRYHYKNTITSTSGSNFIFHNIDHDYLINTTRGMVYDKIFLDVSPMSKQTFNEVLNSFIACATSRGTIIVDVHKELV